MKRTYTRIKAKYDESSCKYETQDTKYFADVYIQKQFGGWCIFFNLKPDTKEYLMNGMGYLETFKTLADVKVNLQNILDTEYEFLFKIWKREDDEQKAKDLYRINRTEALQNCECVSYLPQLNQIVNVKNPWLNKNCTIGEVRFECEQKFIETKFKVIKIINVKTKKYDKIVNNLLKSRKKFNVSYIDDGYNEETDNIDYWTGFALVSTDRETIYIDTQGYDYARYVMLAR